MDPRTLPLDLHKTQSAFEGEESGKSDRRVCRGILREQALAQRARTGQSGARPVLMFPDCAEKYRPVQHKVMGRDLDPMTSPFRALAESCGFKVIREDDDDDDNDDDDDDNDNDDDDFSSDGNSVKSLAGSISGGESLKSGRGDGREAKDVYGSCQRQDVREPGVRARRGTPAVDISDVREEDDGLSSDDLNDIDCADDNGYNDYRDYSDNCISNDTHSADQPDRPDETDANQDRTFQSEGDGSREAHGIKPVTMQRSHWYEKHVDGRRTKYVFTPSGHSGPRYRLLSKTDSDGENGISSCEKDKDELKQIKTNRPFSKGGKEQREPQNNAPITRDKHALDNMQRVVDFRSCRKESVPTNSPTFYYMKGRNRKYKTVEEVSSAEELCKIPFVDHHKADRIKERQIQQTEFAKGIYDRDMNRHKGSTETFEEQSSDDKNSFEKQRNRQHRESGKECKTLHKFNANSNQTEAPNEGSERGLNNTLAIRTEVRNTVRVEEKESKNLKPQSLHKDCPKSERPQCKEPSATCRILRRSKTGQSNCGVMRFLRPNWDTPEDNRISHCPSVSSGDGGGHSRLHYPSHEVIRQTKHVGDGDCSVQDRRQINGQNEPNQHVGAETQAVNSTRPHFSNVMTHTENSVGFTKGKGISMKGSSVVESGQIDCDDPESQVMKFISEMKSRKCQPTRHTKGPDTQNMVSEETNYEAGRSQNFKRCGNFDCSFEETTESLECQKESKRSDQSMPKDDIVVNKTGEETTKSGRHVQRSESIRLPEIKDGLCTNSKDMHAIADFLWSREQEEESNEGGSSHSQSNSYDNVTINSHASSLRMNDKNALQSRQDKKIEQEGHDRSLNRSECRKNFVYNKHFKVHKSMKNVPRIKQDQESSENQIACLKEEASEPSLTSREGSTPKRIANTQLCNNACNSISNSCTNVQVDRLINEEDSIPAGIPHQSSGGLASSLGRDSEKSACAEPRIALSSHSVRSRHEDFGFNLNSNYEGDDEQAVGSKFIGQYFLELWKNQCLCDVRLKVGNWSYLAHKIVLAAFSDYFCPTDPHCMPSVCFEIPDATPSAVHQILLYLYTSEMEITDNTLESVLNAAECLGVTEVINLCKEILSNPAPENFQLYASILKRHGVEVEMMSHLHLIRDNILELTNSPQFLKMDITDIVQILEDPEVKVDSELDMIEVIARWIEYNPLERIEYSHILLGYVNFDCICAEDLASIIERKKNVFSRDSFTMFMNAFLKKTLECAPPAGIYPLDIWENTENNNIYNRRPPQACNQSTNADTYRLPQPPPPPAHQTIQSHGASDIRDGPPVGPYTYGGAGVNTRQSKTDSHHSGCGVANRPSKLTQNRMPSQTERQNNGNRSSSRTSSGNISNSRPSSVPHVAETLSGQPRRFATTQCYPMTPRELMNVATSGGDCDYSNSKNSSKIHRITRGSVVTGSGSACRMPVYEPSDSALAYGSRSYNRSSVSTSRCSNDNNSFSPPPYKVATDNFDNRTSPAYLKQCPTSPCWSRSSRASTGVSPWPSPAHCNTFRIVRGGRGPRWERSRSPSVSHGSRDRSSGRKRVTFM